MKKCFFLLFIYICFFNSCKNQEINKNIISVSILPQKYFIEKIAGKNFKINVMIPPGHSPATYEPTSKQIIEISKSGYYFKIGHIAFEKSQLDSLKSINKSMKIIDLSKGVSLIKSKHLHHHNHHHEEINNAANGIDPHIWLSPKAVKKISKNIYISLANYDPVNKNKYLKNYQKFLKEVDQLEKEIYKILKTCSNKKFIVYHPAWTYFARDFNLKQIPIELDGKAPAADYIKKIIEAAKAEKIKVIFVQKQFPTNNADAIAKDIGGKVIKLDPLSENWMSNMLHIARAFRQELN